jgi:hypothetical protein
MIAERVVCRFAPNRGEACRHTPIKALKPSRIAAGGYSSPSRGQIGIILAYQNTRTNRSFAR